MSVGRKPRKPIPRHTRLRSSGRIAPKPRKPSSYARIYGSKARVRWIKMLPCVGCGRMPTADEPNVNAHTESGHGTGYKADAETIAPMCHRCHTKYDERKAPFDAEDARDAMKLQAAFCAAAWTRMGETRRGA